MTSPIAATTGTETTTDPHLSSTDRTLDPADYEWLRRTARRAIRRYARDDGSVDSIGLVGEAFVRVTKGRITGTPDDPRYAYRAYVKAMRDILIDRYRRRSAAKHGGGMNRVSLDAVIDRLEEQGISPDDLGPAIESLRRAHPLAAEVLDLRFFLDLELPAIARQLGITRYRSQIELGRALGWLHRELEDSRR